jgi:hypothetical protein
MGRNVNHPDTHSVRIRDFWESLRINPHFRLIPRRRFFQHDSIYELLDWLSQQGQRKEYSIKKSRLEPDRGRRFEIWESGGDLVEGRD